MNGVSFQATMGTITSRSDKSLGFRLNTPELSAEEKVAFMELQPELLEVVIKPFDYQSAPMINVKQDKEFKTHSRRLRDVLYVLYTKEDREEDFETYYRRFMDKFIEIIKGKLEEYDWSICKRRRRSHC